MESVSDVAGSGSLWGYCLSEWEQGVDGGAGTKIGGVEMIIFGRMKEQEWSRRADLSGLHIIKAEEVDVFCRDVGSERAKVSQVNHLIDMFCTMWSSEKLEQFSIL